MRIHLQNSENWEDLNAKLKAFAQSELGCDQKIGVKAYRSGAHAIMELFQGAKNFFAHKRGMSWIKWNHPLMPSLLPNFYQDSFQVHTQQGPPQASGREWVETLKKDTNMVYFASDHPLTGELQDYEELDLALNEKRIFSFRLSHQDWLLGAKNKQLELRPYSALIVALSADECLVFHGEKIKLPSYIANSFAFSSESILKNLQTQMEAFLQDPHVIQKFEANLPKAWLPMLSSTNRLWDRAVIFNLNQNGQTLRDQLLSVLPNLHPSLIETGNLGRWNATLPFYHWWEGAPSADILRGSLILSAGELARQDWPQLLQQAESKVRFP